MYDYADQANGKYFWLSPDYVSVSVNSNLDVVSVQGWTKQNSTLGVDTIPIQIPSIKFVFIVSRSYISATASLHYKIWFPDY
ncbi:hypothetical protein [Nostoc sp.]|uniref:hypothetical protein n=1 Tax=Nostoc sp. TaxID=1180 RepID=UPI002FF4E482